MKCSVAGCGMCQSKNRPNLTFHRFPKNKVLSKKWMEAIGEKNLNPQHKYWIVCSLHFDERCFNRTLNVTRLRDNSVPTLRLPPKKEKTSVLSEKENIADFCSIEDPLHQGEKELTHQKKKEETRSVHIELNSNFEASLVEVCRICLAIDVKMYSLQTEPLTHYMETVIGFNENFNTGLPRFVCYECAAHLMKSCCFIEKGMTAQAILLDLFAQNGQITKSLIRNLNRETLDLKSPLEYHKIEKPNLLVYEHDYEQNVSNVTKNQDTQTEIKLVHVDTTENVKDDKLNNEALDQNHLSDMKSISGHSPATNASRESLDDLEEKKSNSDDDENDSDFADEWFDEVESSHISKNVTDDSNVLNVKKDEIISVTTKNKSNVIVGSLDFSKYFNIVKLSTLQRQIEEYRNKMESQSWIKRKDTIQCKLCLKKFAHNSSYQSHKAYHDSSLKEECPVCKHRFKTKRVLRGHINAHHLRKYICKHCPKSFNSSTTAKKHHLWHSGHKYKCKQCASSFLHMSALYEHVHREHAPVLVCSVCGRGCTSKKSLQSHVARAHPLTTVSESNNEYPCGECNFSFSTELARRVHIMTSKVHRHSMLAKDLKMKNTCRHCGKDFSARKDLQKHTSDEHLLLYSYSRDIKDLDYPKKCEHCDAVVSTRREHYFHVKRQHAALAHSYRKKFSVVCDTCGLTFQSECHLRHHALRHSAPRLPCAQCGRKFHDKFALAGHERRHEPRERTHQCARCGRTFFEKFHMERHMRIHSDETPYVCSICGKKFKYSGSVTLHIRTVHQKMPHPPRKKRVKVQKVK